MLLELKEQRLNMKRQIDILESRLIIAEQNQEWSENHCSRHANRASGYEKELFKIYGLIADILSGKKKLETLEKIVYKDKE